ncbi:MAG: cysteine desulfurase, partial [Alphaproteobacteria bacterium]
MTASVSLDLDFVRGQFPAMNDWAYFDNAGGSMVPRTVVDRITANLSETRMQPGGGSPYARRAADSHALAIANMAAMINADEDEVMIGGSTTINMY